MDRNLKEHQTDKDRQTDTQMYDQTDKDRHTDVWLNTQRHTDRCMAKQTKTQTVISRQKIATRH